jgi:hypothetical protein
MEAPISKVHNQAFNTGANELNHQIIELAKIAAETVPGCELELRAQSGADQRTYKADFGKFARTFPDFKFNWNARTGAAQLCRAFQGIHLTLADMQDKRFTRLKWLRHLLETEQLDAALNWGEPANQVAYAGAGDRL